MYVNPPVLITVPQLDHKLLDTTPLTSWTQSDQQVSSTLKQFWWHFSCVADCKRMEYRMLGILPGQGEAPQGD